MTLAALNGIASEGIFKKVLQGQEKSGQSGLQGDNNTQKASDEAERRERVIFLKVLQDGGKTWEIPSNCTKRRTTLSAEEI